MNVERDLPSGENPPEDIFVFIEIQKGSSNKFEFNKKLGLLMLDRVVHSPLFYPGCYGFIPQTYYDDGDALDVLLLVTEPIMPGILVQARPIALLRMEDEKGVDDKILAVPSKDPRFNGFKDMKDVPKHTLDEIAEFFEIYKRLEPNKWAKAKGWFGATKAKKAIEHGMELYNKKFR